jgi:hypothetical protein
MTTNDLKITIKEGVLKVRIPNIFAISKKTGEVYLVSYFKDDHFAAYLEDDEFIFTSIANSKFNDYNPLNYHTDTDSTCDYLFQKKDFTFKKTGLREVPKYSELFKQIEQLLKPLNCIYES